jgi:hypothetical protein
MADGQREAAITCDVAPGSNCGREAEITSFVMALFRQSFAASSYTRCHDGDVTVQGAVIVRVTRLSLVVEKKPGGVIMEGVTEVDSIKATTIE